jgi:hypothetical protein
LAVHDACPPFGPSLRQVCYYVNTVRRVAGAESGGWGAAPAEMVCELLAAIAAPIELAADKDGFCPVLKPNAAG